jgi:phosphoglycerol transferase MdoB-like AlkP superfamily enzyme
MVFRDINIKHPWIVGAMNLLLVMVVYTLTRLFFYWINIDLYPNVSTGHLIEMLIGGLRFDLTALLYINSLYLLLVLLPLPASIRSHKAYMGVAKWTFWIPNIIGFIANCMDIVYVRFTNRRTTCTIFSEFQNDDNIIQVILQSALQYWHVTVFGIVILIIFILCTGKKWEVRTPRRIWAYYLLETLIMLASVYFIVIGIRGGFGKYTRPITISNALQYTNTPQETAIILNTPFSLMKSLENTTYIHPHYFSKEEAESIFTPIHNDQMERNEKLGQTNVVILILESFSKEYIGFYNQHIDGYDGYTPFLDSLLVHSVTYTQSFASGRKSIDAMPSILSSIPMLIEPYIVTPYSTNAVSSIAECLRKEGYTTAFFHGAPNGSMGFQAYARSAGFDRYFGMDEYDGIEAFDGTWAIWDEEFLQYYARSMNQMQQPFMTAVFTASSHHPFRVPKQYEGVFPIGKQPIHQCVGYTDHALRKFFEYAKEQDWYEHTLFVLTADHTNQVTLPEYANAKGLFEVPIAFYSPQWEKGELRKIGTISQTDIMPSVLAYLGYNKPFFAFGENALTHDKQHPWAICYNYPVYQLVSDSLLIQFDGKTISAVYNYDTDPLLQHDITNQVNIDQEEEFLKAYIQQYIYRLTTNQLTIETNGSSSR